MATIDTAAGETARLPGMAARRSVPLILVCGSVIALLSLGERGALGMFLADITAARGWTREAFSLALALQNLVWGIAMPFTGAMADRYGTARVLAIGGVLYAIGLAGSVWAPSPFWLQMTMGVALGLGLAASSFTIVLAAFGRTVSPAKRTLAFGLGTAAGSFGMFVFGGLSPALLSSFGFETALLVFAVLALLIVPLAIPLAGRSAVPDSSRAAQSIGAAIREAFGYRSYVLLVFGFFVCGFHVAFILAHLPPYLDDMGMSVSIGGAAIALIGLFNILGSLVAGWVGGRWSKPYGLSLIYLGRSIAIAAFVLTPISSVSVLVFAAVMGLFWLSTVPLTSGLVAVMFGPRYMATLFGFVFLSHQIGSFLGVWLGGRIYDQTGSYDLLWWMGVALGLFAALVHLPIRDAPAPEVARPAAA
mgnify:CR=1 FL=1